MDSSFRTPEQDREFMKAWEALKQQADNTVSDRILDYFSSEPGRLGDMTASCGDLTLDYSRSAMSLKVRDELLALLKHSGLDAARKAMFGGELLNNTEQRAVLHAALRGSARPTASGLGDIIGEVDAALDSMTRVVQRLHSGSWTGFDGQPITDVVSIGIGGSFLGPEVVVEALRPDWHDGIRVHFVANVDAADILNTLEGLKASNTLFIIQSKSFTTQETLTNALTARAWFLGDASVGALDDSAEALGKHFIAVSSNVEKAQAFGIDPENILPMWDWVGGRYSLWSAIGLPIACQIGMPLFRKLLQGAAAMDEHFLTAPLEENLPALLAMIGIWYNNFKNIGNYAIIPYDQGLNDLAAHLQQVDMESNGKSVQRDGKPVFSQTGTIVWGGAGTNGQHAYHQLIHQGTRVVPVDFILPLRSRQTGRPLSERIGIEQIQKHHRMLISNCLAQSQAMLTGKSLEQARQECLNAGMNESEAEQLAPHKVIQGNKPSTTITVPEVDAFTVGQLIAMYEQRIFVQGVVWNLNSFDQWGVELGKQMCSSILPLLEGGTDASELALDPSTAQLVQAALEANR
ncbi:glucose-6-phosphate isomerase [Allohahella marinimesophila]|uniref:Glucose-6-phosphate isomerase n=1 Tax=Allohahella marinimesophila TaxID=1054972 RepID=A0ABP7P5K9_9GAMM